MSDPVSVLGKYLKDVISKAIAENDLELLRKIKVVVDDHENSDVDEPVSKNAKTEDEQDDEENNHYVYVFLSSDDKILRVGRSKVSKKIRELHTIRESLKDEPKEEYKIIGNHLKSTGVRIIRPFINLTLAQSKDIEALLIEYLLEHKDQELDDGLLNEFTNLLRGTIVSKKYRDMEFKDRLAEAAKLIAGIHQFVEEEGPPILTKDTIKTFNPATNQRKGICSNSECGRYVELRECGLCGNCATNKRRFEHMDFCLGEHCQTPTNEDGMVPIHNFKEQLCATCSARKAEAKKNGGIFQARSTNKCSACDQVGHMKNNKMCPKFSESYPLKDGKRFLKKPPTCGKCGEVGHKRTNKNCPLYGKEEEE